MSATDEGSATTIKAQRSFGEQMREFPWWAVIIVIFLIGAFITMIRDPSYRNALSFIAFPPTETEIAFGLEVRNGLMMTLYTTVIAYLIALILGLILGIMRVSRNPIMYHLSTMYVELMRGVPMLVLIIWIGFVVVPYLRNVVGNESITGLQGALIGLGFGYAAYLAEVYRSGIESIPKGQMEAARSLGMSYAQAMRHVILPQAIRRVVPPLSNDLVAMLKDSALVSVVAVPEILQMARLYVSRTFRAFEGYNSAAFLYLVLTLLFIIIVRMIERRWRASV
ncbi:MAG: amino acid ABC transporter permease [Anaerolineae bacterium]|nr:amino acid ABC transporter permease [Anaerolineae bacterium]MCB0199370.1 amino acid ABC transporter permease [Anaerolineae bacterium]MCB0203351.1 amino acid ABC transporter permease [Anaerolineae bacterium]MCB0256448.1 amino acid ABC transporter permease [Anaerolineae bacterium]